MTVLPIRKVLQKPNLAGRMICWSVELSEFDIEYEPWGLVKGQAYVDFVVELVTEGSCSDPGIFGGSYRSMDPLTSRVAEQKSYLRVPGVC